MGVGSLSNTFTKNEIEILSGSHRGKRHFIPKMVFQPSDSVLPFLLKRVQFPVCFSYSIMINKAQGQTFEKVGIFLDKACFPHGQLYVAFSRARSFADVKVNVLLQAPNQRFHNGKYFTKNVIFQSVLSACHQHCSYLHLLHKGLLQNKELHLLHLCLFLL